MAFPTGFTLSEFPDDVDPISFDELQVADHAKLIDGSIFPYDTTCPVSVKVSVLAGGSDDSNLRTLLLNRRVSNSPIKLPDNIILTMAHPDIERVVLSNGYIRAGAPGLSSSASGRFKSSTYTFVFGAVGRVSVGGLISELTSLADLLL
jgi:hypothetical protein